MTVGGALDHNKIENEPYIFEDGVPEPAGIRGGGSKEKASTPRYKLQSDPFKGKFSER